MDDKSQQTETSTDDRVGGYLLRLLRLSPSRFRRGVRNLWLIGIVANIISFGFVAVTVQSVVMKNHNSQVKFIRVDGKAVHEKRDVRRDVMLNGALQKSQGKNDE
jgi:hypothetical protein